ncbi:MAG: pilus assembly protein N-terminal domain-containing protein [Archangium sp.]|nr:pilus assembly protein N-terminal domain-containing protein [Archangium sp.]
MRFVGLLLLLSTLALAGAPKQVNMPVGHSTTLAMPAPVSSVSVENPDLVDVSQQGRRVVLTGRSAGTTEVTVKTADGEMHLRVYVAADKYGMPH